MTSQAPGRQEPDLYLRVNPRIAFDYEVLIDGRPYSLFDAFVWEYGNISGTHRTEGILVARGPTIRRGVEIRGANLLDIAPTVLHLAGVPVPGDFDGEPLSSMFVDSGVASGLHVVSYETLIDHQHAVVNDTPIDEEYRERLRALGYVQ